MTELWFAAAELAQMALPGMPGTDRAIQLRAGREAWQYRDRQGRGGGREYHISALPLAAREAIARREAAKAAARATTAAHETLRQAVSKPVTGNRASAREAGLKAALSMTDRQECRADAALAIIAAYREFVRVSGLGPEAARRGFTSAYNARQLALEASVYERRRTLSVPTLKRLQQRLDQEGLVALGGRNGRPKGSSQIDRDAEVRDLVIGLVVDRPTISNAIIIDAIEARFGADRVPAKRTLDRWVAGWKAANKALLAAETNPDAWRSKYRASFGSASEEADGLNAIWEMDSTPADIMLLDGRHTIIGCVDVWSRRSVLQVTPTSKAAAVAGTLRRAMLAWGVPRVLRIDNGADYVADYTQRVILALKIEPDPGPKYTPEHKPHIERLFKTWSHDLLELLPGYIGHNVAEQQVIRERKAFWERLKDPNAAIDIKMTAEELQAFCDQWCEFRYAHRVHGQLGGLSPFQKALSWTGATRRIEDEHALDLLLAPVAGTRTVRKKGIEVDGAWFVANELGLHVGEAVHVRQDPADLGRVHVFAANGTFIAIATAVERLGIDRREVAMVARAKQKAQVAEGRKALKAIRRRANTGDVVQDILAAAEAKANRVIALPRAAETHTTPALQEAAKVAQALSGMPAVTVPQEELQRRREAAERMVAETRQAPLSEREIKRQRYRRARELEDAIEAGQPVDVDDLEWLQTYSGTAEYRSLRGIEADFGRAAAG
jgi:putative transposase